MLLFIFTATSHAWDQCAALLIFSRWAFTNLGVNASARTSTLFLGPTPDEHVNVSRILLQVKRQPATGYYCELGRGRRCLLVIFCSSLSDHTDGFRSLHRLGDSLSTVLSATLLECGNHRPPLACYASRTWATVPPRHLSLLSRASSNLCTVSWTRHLLSLQILLDSGNLRSLFWCVTNSDVGASVSSAFVFGTGLQPVRQWSSTVP